jgi:predicted RNA binding protein YcfA (HicA-like mRNA interferase family)
MPKLSPVSYQVLVRVFERGGFRCARQEAEHIIYSRPGVARPVVISKYHAVPVFIIKQNLRSAGISRERYFELLDET